MSQERMDVTDCDGGQHLKLKQKQKLRSIQASQQMLFDVFEFVITMLEEFERRELQSTGGDPNMMPESNVQSPDQRHKDFEDGKRILEAQLLMFQSQLSACPKKAKKTIRSKLKWKTFGWAAVRAEKIPHHFGNTDKYLAYLYKILATGTTHQPEEEEVTVEDMTSFVPASIMAGRHNQEEFDKVFKEDKERKAVPPDVRSLQTQDVRSLHNTELLRQGAGRMLRYLPKELHEHVWMDLQQFVNVLEKKRTEQLKEAIEKEAGEKGSVN